ncbi:Gfo/Idh/MocA family oxidoreductase [Shigella flexneri]
MSETSASVLFGDGDASKTFHAPRIGVRQGMELAAITSSDETKVRADWPAVPVVTSLSIVHLFLILTLLSFLPPMILHSHWRRRHWRQGKHVVVDKPFTVTLSQARELDGAAKVWVGYCRSFTTDAGTAIS